MKIQTIYICLSSRTSRRGRDLLSLRTRHNFAISTGGVAEVENLQLNTISYISARVLRTKRFAPPREYPTHRKVRDEWGTPQLW